jgi:hypothetical protein
MIAVPNTADEGIFSFVRRNGQDKVFAIFNLSPDEHSASFGESLCHGEYLDFFTEDGVTVDESTSMTLAPWTCRILLAT